MIFSKIDRLSILRISLILMMIKAISPANGQTNEVQDKGFNMLKTQDPIIVDGLLNENAWNSAAELGDFYQYFPFDTSLAAMQTKVKILYDQDYIYIGATLLTKKEGDFVSLSLRRDFIATNADNFTVVIDAFNDGTNALFFGVNPFNVQREGLIFNGGANPEDLDLSWDNIWYSATSVGEDNWSLEMKIPFNTLRFNAESELWAINFLRVDTKQNESSVWSQVPRQFQMFNLAYSGSMRWEEKPPSEGMNISLIPYIAGGIDKDHLEGTESENNISFGGDAKLALTPSLNLDLTFNPDFSQVEVDQQQTNIDRFEIFFPERRQFFLENADLFSNFGFPNARPFFSRRIGVAIDSTTGQNVQNRIIAGARLSGKIGDDWRIGLLNMHTETNEAINVQGSNFSVAAIQKKVFARSNISAILINQQTPSDRVVNVFNPEMGSYSRLAGIEYNLASADGRWTGKTYYQHTFDEGDDYQNFAHGTTVSYNTLRFFSSWTHQIVGEGFRANVGFVPRNNFKRVNPVVGFNLYPQSKLINSHQISVSNNWLWNEDWGITDYNFAVNWAAFFQNTAVFNFSILSNYVKLFAPFNPTGNTERQFQPGDDFVQTGFLASFQTDRRRPLSGRAQVISGGFFNGSLRQISGSLDYRYDRYATFAITYNVNKIILTDDFEGTTFVLVGPRLDITFTNNLFWTTFLQYNDQFDNININSRLQWRFRPVSDLFIVYSDNYFPENLKVKNRTLIAKFTYWLNL